LRRKENRRTWRKNPGAWARTNNKLNPHMTPGPGIEPGTHWWEASLSPQLHPASRQPSGDLCGKGMQKLSNGKTCEKYIRVEVISETNISCLENCEHQSACTLETSPS